MDDKTKARVLELQARLKSLNENFDREMRARGFEPAQAEKYGASTIAGGIEQPRAKRYNMNALWRSEDFWFDFFRFC